MQRYKKTKFHFFFLFFFCFFVKKNSFCNTKARKSTTKNTYQHNKFKYKTEEFNKGDKKIEKKLFCIQKNTTFARYKKVDYNKKF